MNYKISTHANRALTTIEELYKIKGGIIAMFGDNLNSHIVNALDNIDCAIMYLNNETQPMESED